MSFSSSQFENDRKNPDSKGLSIEDLIKENQSLKEEINVLRSEKVLNTSCQNREKEILKNNLKELQDRLVKERLYFKNEIIGLTNQLDELKNSVDRMISIRMQISVKNQGKKHRHKECLRKTSLLVSQENRLGENRTKVAVIEDME
ncbi:hypothetical protein SteCoe_29726 [Stentor coeruleus]|uniref:Uncharacterized protein n=1 Tax=Stentor coeruleus TaxID=5963 RepID=A0A1R2B585_9CILI|nr:hypothetical protein SteCoe_29726 [Stentor coeruleus]